MNRWNMWTALGVGTLSTALIALPGSSRPTQESNKPTAKIDGRGEYSRAQTRNDEEMQGQADALQQKVILLGDELQEGNPRIKVYNQGVDPDSDDDTQVFLGSWGGWLGVGVSEVSTAKAKELKLPEERGAVLGKIVADSPAAKAGLKENDVVTEINGQRVEGTEQFRRMVHEIPAGRTANLTVWRDGRRQTVKVTLGKPEAASLKVFTHNPKAFSFNMPELSVIPDLSGLNQLRSFSLVSPGHPTLGIDAENLDGEFGQYFGAPDGEGVLVRGVFANSPAAKAGLKVGDVITSLNGERIRNASELRERILTKQDDRTMKLGVVRNKSDMTVSVELPKPAEQEEPFLSERTHI
jgi:serine protease Do